MPITWFDLPIEVRDLIITYVLSLTDVKFVGTSVTNYTATISTPKPCPALRIVSRGFLPYSQPQYDLETIRKSGIVFSSCGQLIGIRNHFGTAYFGQIRSLRMIWDHPKFPGPFRYLHVDRDSMRDIDSWPHPLPECISLPSLRDFMLFIPRSKVKVTYRSTVGRQGSISDQSELEKMLRTALNNLIRSIPHEDRGWLLAFLARKQDFGSIAGCKITLGFDVDWQIPTANLDDKGRHFKQLFDTQIKAIEYNVQDCKTRFVNMPLSSIRPRFSQRLVRMYPQLAYIEGVMKYKAVRRANWPPYFVPRRLKETARSQVG